MGTRNENLSLVIRGVNDPAFVGIYVREWVCQMEPPEYTLIAKIPRERGEYLVENNLIHDLHGIFDKKAEKSNG